VKFANSIHCSFHPKKRQRPSVPSRDTSVSPSADISTSGYQESPSVDISTSRYQESLSLESPSLDISTSGQQDSQVSRIEPEQLLTKQTTFRLEAALSQRLSEVCQNNGISREVLLEALFEHYSNDPEAWQAILTEAKRRGERRMQVANLKRAKSMMQRFGS
jgi:predicted DNA-binding protein